MVGTRPAEDAKEAAEKAKREAAEEAKRKAAKEAKEAAKEAKLAIYGCGCNSCGCNLRLSEVNLQLQPHEL